MKIIWNSPKQVSNFYFIWNILIASTVCPWNPCSGIYENTGLWEEVYSVTHNGNLYGDECNIV